jgi:YD repeat-containing protein
MNSTDLLETVGIAVRKYSMSVRLTGSSVSVYDRKGNLAGTVAADGTVEQKYAGKKNLMGALVRDDINAALKGKL